MTFQPDAELLAQLRGTIAEFDLAVAAGDVHRIWFQLRDMEEDALVLRNSLPPLPAASTDDIILG